MKLKIGWLIGWGGAPVVGGEHKDSSLPQTAKRAPKANLQSSNTGSLTQFCLHLILPTAGELQLCLDPDSHFSDSAFLLLLRSLKFEEKTFESSLETQEHENHSYFQCNEALNPSIF